MRVVFCLCNFFFASLIFPRLKILLGPYYVNVTETNMQNVRETAKFQHFNGIFFSSSNLLRKS